MDAVVSQPMVANMDADSAAVVMARVAALRIMIAPLGHRAVVRVSRGGVSGPRGASSSGWGLVVRKAH